MTCLDLVLIDPWSQADFWPKAYLAPFRFAALKITFLRTLKSRDLIERMRVDEKKFIDSTQYVQSPAIILFKTF
jgi:hypothetical protein